MSEQQDVFAAIADPKRRMILDVLAHQKEAITLNMISERFDVSRQAVRKHIKILQNAGLVSLEKQGREQHCKADLTPLKTIFQWVSLYEQFWGEKLVALGSYLDEQETVVKSTNQNS